MGHCQDRMRRNLFYIAQLMGMASFWFAKARQGKASSFWRSTFKEEQRCVIIIFSRYNETFTDKERNWLKTTRSMWSNWSFLNCTNDLFDTRNDSIFEWRWTIRVNVEYSICGSRRSTTCWNTSVRIQYLLNPVVRRMLRWRNMWSLIQLADRRIMRRRWLAVNSLTKGGRQQPQSLEK